MFLEKIHFYIALFAGLVMTAVNIYIRASLLDVSIRLIITLTLFYLAGYAAQRYIRKKILKPKEAVDQSDFEDERENPTLIYDEPVTEDSE